MRGADDEDAKHDLKLENAWNYMRRVDSYEARSKHAKFTCTMHVQRR